MVKELDMIVIAGQSNAQGWMADGSQYPTNIDDLDRSIPLYWFSPTISSSQDEWTHLKPQDGRFDGGHFGPEVTFARALKRDDHHPAIFKYTLGGTSLERDWQALGDGKMYDGMIEQYELASSLLVQQGYMIRVSALVWIQGESDAETPEMAKAYKERLRTLLEHFRQHVLKSPECPVLLGLDEQHPLVQEHGQVLVAQQELAQEMKNTIFTSMLGLEKADQTHLTAKGVEKQGLRIYDDYQRLMGSIS